MATKNFAAVNQSISSNQGGDALIEKQIYLIDTSALYNLLLSLSEKQDIFCN